MKNLKVNEIITNQIIENLEKSGKWVKNWQSLTNINAISRKQYRGVNTLLLAISREKNSFSSNYWLTFNQVDELAICLNCGKKFKRSKWNKKGCCSNPKPDKWIKRNNQGTIIIFYKELEPKTAVVDGKEMIDLNSPTFALRYYKVFNLDQTENVVIDNKLIGEDNKIIPSAYNLAFSYLKRENIKLNSWKSQACYYPKSDKIDMPDLKQFDSSDNYYKTLFHEITHSTGIEKRLNRYETGELLNESKEDYSKEELVAELGSLFLSSHSGLDVNIKNSSAYIRGWCKALKDDHQLIISASSKAQKAFDYITK